MYLFVYKTTHINGKYYIGRHSTDNLNDGYLGSGKWVQSIKDKTTLSREIISEAQTFKELCELEEKFISQHYDDPMCMNYIRGSDGWTSQDASEQNRRRVENGTHHLLSGEQQKAIQLKRIANGTHNFLGENNPSHERVANGTHNFQNSEFAKENNRKRIEAGTHHFVGDSNPVHKQLANGTHNFQVEGFQKKNNLKRVANGTHNFQVEGFQKKNSIKRIEAGTHHFLGPNSPSQFVWSCEACGKTGKGKGIFTRFHGDKCKVLKGGE